MNPVLNALRRVIQPSLHPRTQRLFETPFSGEACKKVNELQWGRGISAAESTHLYSNIHGDTWLQWGRGIRAAESVHPATLAAIDQTLHWGRGISAAERA